MSYDILSQKTIKLKGYDISLYLLPTLNNAEFEIFNNETKFYGTPFSGNQSSISLSGAPRWFAVYTKPNIIKVYISLFYNFDSKEPIINNYVDKIVKKEIKTFMNKSNIFLDNPEINLYKADEYYDNCVVDVNGNIKKLFSNFKTDKDSYFFGSTVSRNLYFGKSAAKTTYAVRISPYISQMHMNLELFSNAARVLSLPINNLSLFRLVNWYLLHPDVSDIKDLDKLYKQMLKSIELVQENETFKEVQKHFKLNLKNAIIDFNVKEIESLIEIINTPQSCQCIKGSKTFEELIIPKEEINNSTIDIQFRNHEIKQISLVDLLDNKIAGINLNFFEIEGKYVITLS